MPIQPMSGARFARYVGVDPEKWAEQFLQAYAQADAVRTDADRQAFVAHWFADAMDAAAGVATLADCYGGAGRITRRFTRISRRHAAPS